MDVAWNSTSAEPEVYRSRLTVFIYVLVPCGTNVPAMLQPRYPGEPVTLFNDLQYNDYGYATLKGAGLCIDPICCGVQTRIRPTCWVGQQLSHLPGKWVRKRTTPVASGGQATVDVGDFGRQLAYIIDLRVVHRAIHVRQIIPGFAVNGDTEGIYPGPLGLE